MTATRNPDVPRLLGLTGPGAWAMAGLFWATYLVLVAFSGGAPMRTVEGWIALLLTLASAVVVVLPGRYPLRLPIVLAVLGVVAFSTVAIVWNLSPVGWPGWTSWNFGSCTFLLFMLALRGRAVWGAAGVIVMMALTIHWSWATSGDPWHGFDLTYRQLATYFAGTFFALWLRRTARQIVEFQETQQRRVRQEQSRESTAAERSRELERVRRLADHALAQIQRGEATTETRRAHGLLEAHLRDGIRGRTLADEGALAAALRAARSRGARVALLDDLPRGGAPIDDQHLDAARRWIAERIAGRDDDVTVRLALAAGEPVVTVATAAGEVETFSLPADRTPRAERDPRA